MIYIPTYGRLHKQRTIKWFGKRDLARTVLVVRKSEEREAVRMYGRILGGVVTCAGLGVAAARQRALEVAKEDVIAFFDDDLQFCQRVKDWDIDTNNHALKPTQSEVDAAVQWLFDNTSEEYPVTALGPRGGNNTIEERWTVENTRIMRSFAVHRPTLLKHNIRFDAFYYWEDFHVALSLLELGYKNLVNVDAITGGDTNSAGGVARHLHKMWETIRAFKEEHPTIRIREKHMNDGDRKSSTGKVVVPDMTVYWKKAFRSKV